MAYHLGDHPFSDVFESAYHWPKKAAHCVTSAMLPGMRSDPQPAMTGATPRR